MITQLYSENNFDDETNECAALLVLYKEYK